MYALSRAAKRLSSSGVGSPLRVKEGGSSRPVLAKVDLAVVAGREFEPGVGLIRELEEVVKGERRGWGSSAESFCS